MTDFDPAISAANPPRMRAESAAWFHRLDLAVVPILILPWILLWIRVNWVADYVFGHGWLDPWFYLGFFLDLRKHMQLFPGTYFGSRLSWILPGHLAYRFLPPRIAAYTLHFGLYYAATLSLYITLKHVVGRRTALVTTMLMGSYAFFLWAVGWDYVDGAGLTYFLLTTLALTLAFKSKHPGVWLTLAGVFYGAMIYSQLFLVVFTPAILIYYFSANRQWSRYSLFIGALTSFLGFLAISVVLGFVNYRLGGSFLFYTPSVREAIDLSKADPWQRPFQLWWRGANWLAITAVIFVYSLASFGKFRHDREKSAPLLFQGYFLGCALISVFVEIKGMPALQYAYYASFLIPTVFLAVGAQIGPRIERLSFGIFTLIFCEAAVIPLLGHRASPRLAVWANFHLPLFLFIIGVLGIVFLCLEEHPARTIAFCSLLCLAVGLVNYAAEPVRVVDPDAANYGWDVIAQSVETIRSIEPNGGMLFWYDYNDPMGDFYRGVASTYLWGYTLVNERFPSLDHADDSAQVPTTRNHIVILSNDDTAFQKAAAAIYRIGLSAQFLTQRRIQRGSIGWNLIFVGLEQVTNQVGYSRRSPLN